MNALRDGGLINNSSMVIFVKKQDRSDHSQRQPRPDQ